MKIISWNLRCVWKNGDGINDFIHRAGFIYDKITSEKPALIGFQEMTSNSLQLLKRMLPEYEFFGGMRSENYDGEGLYLAFLKDEFIFTGGEVFWMSPTPYVAGSRFKDQSDCPRICVYAKLVDKKSKRVFNFFDLHLDHISSSAAYNGLNCVFDYIDEREGCIDKDNTVIMGDFNSFENSPTVEFARGKSWLFEATENIKETFHAFGQRKNNNGEKEFVKIDYVFISRALESRMEKAETWKDEKDGIYLSDHYPVCIELT
ncbi:MAG: hypothetical protein IJ800_01195 [Clostridia bacterium]|nr:hypothetical protein [Clostridia bacterium]